MYIIEWIWGIPIPYWQFLNLTYTLNKIFAFLIKNMYIFFKGNHDPILHYLGLHLWKLNEFKAFPYPFRHFYNLCIFLRKIRTFLRKIHAFFFYSRLWPYSTSYGYKYSLMEALEWIWGLPTPRCPFLNPTNILKKNTYILKNIYMLSYENYV